MRSTAARLNTVLLAVAAIILITMVSLAYREWNQYTLARAVGLHAIDIEDSVENLQLSLLEAETGQRGFLLTNEDRYLEPYNRAIQAIPAEVANLSRLLTPSQSQTDARALALNNLVNRKLRELGETVDLRRKQGITPAMEVVLSDRGEQAMNEIRARCSTIRRQTESELKEVQTRALMATRGALLVTTAGSLFLLAFFIVGHVTIGRAILARERTQEILRNTNEALQEFADIVDPAAVMVQDIGGRIIRWTSGAQALYGFAASEVLGKVSHEIFTTAFPEPLDQIRARLFASGRWEGELQQKRRNGQEIVVASVWALHRNKQDQPVAILQVNNDITERKRLEDQIRFKAEELEAFLDAAPVFVWTAHDPDCRFITGNRAANQLFGVEPGTNVSQMPGRIPSIPVKHLKPDGTEYCREELPMQRAVATGRSVNNAELEFELPDGRRVPTVGNAAPLFDAAGRVRGCVSAFLDITELRQAEERFRLVVEAAPNGMVLADEVGDIVLVNSEMERLFGYRRDEMIGQPVESLVSQRLGDEHLRYRKSFWANPRARRMGERRDLHARRKDGSEFPVEIALNPIETSRGRWVLSAVVDITERKRMEQERLESVATERNLASERALRETEAELARIARALTLGELAASIAHEVNQPLAGVVTNAEACLRWLGAETPNVQEAKDSLALIVRDANRASAVIRRIREILKKETPETTSFDINEVILEVAALAGGGLAESQVQLQLRLATGLPQVRGDKIQLQQVILNLIMNGREAMVSVADRSRELVVTSQEYAEAGGRPGVLVMVRDCGVGIKPKDIDRMFDPFFTTKPTGMGMGLSISRSIMESHGGRIWATVNEGPGLTVQFILPAGSESVVR